MESFYEKLFEKSFSRSSKTFHDIFYCTMCFRPFLRKASSPQLGPNSQLRGVLFLFHLVGEDIILPFQNIFSSPFGGICMCFVLRTVGTPVPTRVDICRSHYHNHGRGRRPRRPETMRFSLAVRRDICVFLSREDDILPYMK